MLANWVSLSFKYRHLISSVEPPNKRIVKPGGLEQYWIFTNVDTGKHRQKGVELHKSTHRTSTGSRGRLPWWSTRNCTFAIHQVEFAEVNLLFWDYFKIQRLPQKCWLKRSRDNLILSALHARRRWFSPRSTAAAAASTTNCEPKVKVLTCIENWEPKTENSEGELISKIAIN